MIVIKCSRVSVKRIINLPQKNEFPTCVECFVWHTHMKQCVSLALVELSPGIQSSWPPSMLCSSSNGNRQCLILQRAWSLNINRGRNQQIYQINATWKAIRPKKPYECLKTILCIQLLQRRYSLSLISLHLFAFQLPRFIIVIRRIIC